METFATQRLRGEKLHERHLPDLIELHLDGEVMRFLGGIRSPEATAGYLADNVAHWGRHDFGLWVVRTPDGTFAGRVGIRHLVVGDAPEVEVAYTFRRALWGQGLASEVIEFLADVGLKRLAFPSLVGVASVGNIASRRVLEKSGFAFERTVNYLGEDVVLYRRRRATPSASTDLHRARESS